MLRSGTERGTPAGDLWDVPQDSMHSGVKAVGRWVVRVPGHLPQALLRTVLQRIAELAFSSVCESGSL